MTENANTLEIVPETKKDKAVPLPTFALNGKTIDLAKAVPLTIGDIKTLQGKGHDVLKMNQDNLDIDEIVAVLEYVLGKANEEVKQEDILSMPLQWMNRLSILIFQHEVDTPF